MNKHIVSKWIDLGDFGQHQAEIVAILGEFAYIAICEVTVKGERVNLVPLITTQKERELIEEIDMDLRPNSDDEADFRRMAA